MSIHFSALSPSSFVNFSFYSKKFAKFTVSVAESQGWAVGLNFRDYLSRFFYPGFCVEFFFKREKTALLRYTNKEYAVCQLADIFMKAI